MHSIEIYGYADQEICAGCDGHCGEGSCQPGAKQKTIDLVETFKVLTAQLKLEIRTTFYEATDENLARHEDVRRLLSMADLTPAIVMDGKLLYFGGFSPEGLVEEVSRRLEDIPQHGER
ncbi:MAG: hypothetical protein SNJ56_00325 [Termitinemataceae bacterium]